MKTIIAAAAITALVVGTGSAYADGGNIHSDTQFTELPGVIAHSPHYTRPAFANNAGHTVSFMRMPGQFAFPPGYKPYYDHAHHIVTLRYAHRIVPNNQPAGHAVSFMAMPGQIAFPPGYKPYYDHAHHVITLRYAPRGVAPHYAHRVVTNNSNQG